MIKTIAHAVVFSVAISTFLTDRNIMEDKL